MTEQELITKDPNAPETLDWQALLADGISYVQSLSRDSWTDFNEHDPGVTILENLVFALTDISYRTNHSIGDIIASSAASTKTPLDRLPLFTGDNAFTTAPVTENDYRKLIYDQVEDVRDVWMVPRKEGHGASGLFDVLIQPYPPVPSESGSMIRPDETAMLKEVRKLLDANRVIGIDFTSIRLIPEKIFSLELELAVAPDANPNICIAEVLFAVDNSLNPPPEIEDVDQALYAGTPPDTLFQGPKLGLGAIQDRSLRPITTEIDLNKTRAAILNAPGVLNVGQLQTHVISKAHGGSLPTLPSLSREPADLAGIRALRGGTEGELDFQRIMVNLRHLEEKRRWQVSYAMRRMSNTSYATVPLGKDDRHLGKYRSIQHLFPEIYGIGEKGTEGALPMTERGMNSHQKMAERRARARQLKGYLVFFEQMMTDHLSQLDATADLLSLPSDRPTYNWQGLTRPNPRPDDPPDIAPILGGPVAQKPHDDCAWLERYSDGVAAIYADIDRPAERRGRALDHLLARFGERFDSKSLKRLYDDQSKPIEEFENWLLQRKAQFLENVIKLGGKRGLGVDLSGTAASAIEELITLRSGHDAPLYLIEHLLLRDGATGGGIGAEELGVDFVVTAPPPLSAFSLTLDEDSVHWIIDTPTLKPDLTTLRDHLFALGADPANYQAYPPGSYQISVRLEDGSGLAVDVLENFRSMDEAQSAIKDMQRCCQQAQSTSSASTEILTPALLPLAFYDHASSLLISAGPDDTSRERRAFVTEVAVSEIPTHLACIHLWLEPEVAVKFAKDYEDWRNIHCGIRATTLPSRYALQEAAKSSETLRTHIHKLYCESIQKARKRRRESLGKS